MPDLLDLPRLSIEERDHRWARVRQAMAERNLACIITPPHTGHWEQFAADTRYLTHIGGNNSETACVFPLEGDVTGIVLNRPDFWGRAQNWVTDLRTQKQARWAPVIIERMRELGITNQRVGVVGLENGIFAAEGFFPHTMFEAVRDAFPNAVFEDVTVMMGDVRSLKSREEIGCLEKSVEIIEAGFKAVAETARPGVPDYEVYTALYSAMMNAGGEIPTLAIWGTAPGKFEDAFIPTRRPLQKGDWFANEVQARYLGYGAQRVQPGMLGEAPKIVVDAMDKQRVVFEAVRERLRPGTTVAEVVEAAHEAAEEVGVHAHLTLQGRGLGEDRPHVVHGNMSPAMAKFPLQEGHVLAVKPQVEPKEGPAIMWGDTVVVTRSGGRRLGKDPHQLLVIPC